MAFTDSQGFKIPRPFVNEGGVRIENITENETLTMKSSTIQRLRNNTGGSLDVTLPGPLDGAIFWVGNAGSDNIVVKNTGGVEVGTIGSGKAGLFCSDSTVWMKVFVSAAS